MAFLNFIATHWFELLIAVIVLIVAGVSIAHFIKLPVNQKYSRIREWLLYAVVQAEKEWGSGTGPIKLSQVYNMFVARYPFVKIFISFETFSELVDSALEEMKRLLERKKIDEAINGVKDVN